MNYKSRLLNEPAFTVFLSVLICFRKKLFYNSSDYFRRQFFIIRKVNRVFLNGKSTEPGGKFFKNIGAGIKTNVIFAGGEGYFLSAFFVIGHAPGDIFRKFRNGFFYYVTKFGNVGTILKRLGSDIFVNGFWSFSAIMPLVCVFEFPAAVRTFPHKNISFTVIWLHYNINRFFRKPLYNEIIYTL